MAPLAAKYIGHSAALKKMEQGVNVYEAFFELDYQQNGQMFKQYFCMEMKGAGIKSFLRTHKGVVYVNLNQRGYVDKHSLASTGISARAPVGVPYEEMPELF